MTRWLRGFSVMLGTVVLILAQAAPAVAYSVSEGDRVEDRSAINLVFDAIVLRPLGLVATLTGAVLFAVPVAPIVALTRPSDLPKPLEYLVLRPARYTFQDPLGHH